MKQNNLWTKIKNHFLFIKEYAIPTRKEIEYAILIKDVTKKFKKFTAVKAATIKVNPGTIHGFIGPNGSGKTTTIKCLINAMNPTTGEILVFGHPAITVKAKKHLGYIPESARFPKRTSTEKYLIAMGQIAGLTAKEAKSKTISILKDIDLFKFKTKNPNDFSSGMKKKILLAQSLLNNPDILILDEPAANLDPTARTELFNDLRKLRDQGKTVFISSHILSELQHLVDEFTILNFGDVVYHGKVEANTNKYEINSNNNELLNQILVTLNFTVEQLAHTLIVNTTAEAQVYEIQDAANKNNIKIKSLKPHEFDLQKIYEEIVIKAKNSKEQA